MIFVCMIGIGAPVKATPPRRAPGDYSGTSTQGHGIQ